jgi:hypothetical protein
MSAIVANDTDGLNTHGNDLAAKVGSTSVADNVSFGREGRPERRNGFKDYSTNLPDFAPQQLISSAAGSTAYMHLDGGLWYNVGAGWIRRGSAPGVGASTFGGIWVDSAEENAYICDTTGHAVFCLNFARGSFSVLAGLPGTSGTANGTGTAARFNTPIGIWGDGTNLYVCDKANFAIRKIVIATGIVTTFAGLIGTTAHTDNATGTSARFQSPHGIWGDGTNLYVTEKADGFVRKIVIAGVQPVTTLTSGLTTPEGVWIAAGGSTLYISSNDATEVKQIPTATGIAASFATGLGGAGGSTLMHADATYFWVTSWDANQVYRVTRASGVVDNNVFLAVGGFVVGVWSFSNKLWVTGKTAALSVLYPDQGQGLYALYNLIGSSVSGNTASAYGVYVDIEGPSE